MAGIKIGLSGFLGLILLTGSVQAQIHFNHSSIDAGVAYRGAPLSGRFDFTVKGHQPVQMVSARGSCGCAKPKIETRLYQPGEQGHVLLEIKTLSQAPGSQTWTAYITVRQGQEEQEIPLSLSARLVAEIKVEPASIIVHAERIREHRVVVTDLRARPLSIKAARTSSPYLRARLGQPGVDDTGHRQWKIEFELADAYPEGKREERLDIITEDLSYAHLEVPITILKRVPQRVTATPCEATMVLQDGATTASRLILLSAGEGQSLEIDRIESDRDAITTRFAKGPGERVTLRIQVDRTRLNGEALQGTVRVHCRQPEGAVLAIPVATSIDKK